MIYVYRDGIEIGRAAVSTNGLGQGLGSHVYSALDKFDQNGLREWISTASFGPGTTPDIKELAKRVSIPPAFLDQARGAVLPGTTLIITDVPVSEQTHSGSGFNILTTDGPTFLADVKAENIDNKCLLYRLVSFADSRTKVGY